MFKDETISAKIKNKALSLGFDDVGVAEAQNSEQLGKRLYSWINKGYHAEMSYMKNNIETRCNPALYLPGAKSIIVVILNYYQGNIQTKSKYKVAQFAHMQDYHYIIKKRLEQLLSYIIQIEPNAKGKISVDAQPVAERYWAVKAGLGFIGQNTMFIHPKLGSFNLIGTIITDIELDYDKSNTETCLSCGKCINSCPNHAIIKPYLLDSRYCISYQTIESRSKLETKNNFKTDNYIFGCDICNLVCPHNNNIIIAKQGNISIKPEIGNMCDNDWQTISSSRFKRLFSHSPIRRAGLGGIRKNIALCEK